MRNNLFTEFIRQCLEVIQVDAEIGDINLFASDSCEDARLRCNILFCLWMRSSLRGLNTFHRLGFGIFSSMSNLPFVFCGSLGLCLCSQTLKTLALTLALLSLGLLACCLLFSLFGFAC